MPTTETLPPAPQAARDASALEPDVGRTFVDVRLPLVSSSAILRTAGEGATEGAGAGTCLSGAP